MVSFDLHTLKETPRIYGLVFIEIMKIYTYISRFFLSCTGNKRSASTLYLQVEGKVYNLG